jgi:hypothetical protein
MRKCLSVCSPEGCARTAKCFGTARSQCFGEEGFSKFAALEAEEKKSFVIEPVEPKEKYLAPKATSLPPPPPESRPIVEREKTASSQHVAVVPSHPTLCEPCDRPTALIETLVKGKRFELSILSSLFIL